MPANPVASPMTIEVGIILAGRLEQIDRKAIEDAVQRLQTSFSELLPEFAWRFRKVVRDEWPSAHRLEPMELMNLARQERDEAGWDFVIVVTAADLISHYRPATTAVISSALDIAVLSTARIDPRATSPHSTDTERSLQMSNRAVHLMMHAVGHWLGLEPTDKPNNAMNRHAASDGPDSPPQFTPKQIEEMKRALAAIADQRLEEREEYRRTANWRFYLAAAWQNRREIVDAVMQARPWEFPMRLSRFTTAALSTVTVLLMTAETWDMAMSQRPMTLVGMFFFVMVATTCYVTVRQRLFVRSNRRRLSEQIVATNLSALAVITLGMLVMFGILVLLTLVGSLALFPTKVVEGWAAAIDQSPTAGHYLLLASTVGSLGLLIGALGASFEEAYHFQHVVFVDEEV